MSDRYEKGGAWDARSAQAIGGHFPEQVAPTPNAYHLGASRNNAADLAERTSVLADRLSKVCIGLIGTSPGNGIGGLTMPKDKPTSLGAALNESLSKIAANLEYVERTIIALEEAST